MPNSGYVDYTTLEEYYLDNSIVTGNTKTNTFGDPDYIPTFYDTSLCPLASLTPTPTATPSITPTPSTQGIFGKYDVHIYAKLDGISALNETVNVYYSTDNTTWYRLATISDAACKDLGIMSVQGGTTLYLAMMTGSSTSTDIGNGVGKDVDTSFLASNIKRCEMKQADTTTYCGISTPYSIYIVQNTDISLAALIDPADYTLQNCGSSLKQRLTPTPSTSPGQYFTEKINIASALEDVCVNNYNVTTIDVVGSDTLYCTSQQFFSSYFSSISKGVYYANYNNYVMALETDGETNFAAVLDTCTLCSSIPVTPSPTITPTPSVSVGSTVTVNSFGVNLFSCVNENDYLGYYVNLNTNTPDDLFFNMSIDMYSNEKYVFTNNLQITVPSGSNRNISGYDPCTDGGGIYNNPENYPGSVCVVNIISGSTFIYNPFGYCSGTGEAPSATPSSTPAVSATPSITPTITNTPSITPTKTITPTPTPSVASNFRVENNGGPGSGQFDIASIVAVQDIGTFYTIKTGSFPLAYPDVIIGNIKNNVTGPIRVTITNFVGNLGLTLYKNGILQQCISVFAEQTVYTFNTVSFNTSDTMTIKVEKAC